MPRSRKSTQQQPNRPTKKTAAKAAKQPAPKQSSLPSKPEPAKEVKKEAPLPIVEEKIQVILDQSVAILVDGNNIEMSLHSVSGKKGAMINFDKLVPALLQNRALSRLIYFREGKSISQRLAERLQKLFHGSVVPCYKSADIPLTIKAVQVASKVDTIIILSGDADYVELVRHLKHDGIRVEIAAFPETTADILRAESDYFFPITVEYSFVLK
ncbi:MAG: NYN domain-containing protein [Saprospiraceae bacterium]